MMNPTLIEIYKRRRHDQQQNLCIPTPGEHAQAALASARLGLRIRQQVARSNFGMYRSRGRR